MASRRTLVKADNGSQASLSSSDTGYCEEVLDNHDNMKLESIDCGNSLPREHHRRSFRDEDSDSGPVPSKRSGIRPPGRRHGGPSTDRPLSVKHPQELRETTPDIIASAKEVPRQPPRSRGWNLLSGLGLPLMRPTNSPSDPQVSQAGHSRNTGRPSSPAGTSTPPSDGEGLGGTLMKTLTGVSGWLSNRLLGHGPRDIPDENKPPSPNVQLMVVTKADGTQRVQKKRKNSDTNGASNV